jgi:hypothetical protein
VSTKAQARLNGLHPRGALSYIPNGCQIHTPLFHARIGKPVRGQGRICSKEEHRRESSVACQDDSDRCKRGTFPEAKAGAEFHDGSHKERVSQNAWVRDSRTHDRSSKRWHARVKPDKRPDAARGSMSRWYACLNTVSVSNQSVADKRDTTATRN